MNAGKITEAGKTTLKGESTPEVALSESASGTHQFTNNRGGYDPVDIGDLLRGSRRRNPYGQSRPQVREISARDMYTPATEYAQNLFESVARAAGLDPSDYIFGASNEIDNAAATLVPERVRLVPVQTWNGVGYKQQAVGDHAMLVIYNRAFMQQLELSTNNEMVAAMVLAHELGHHHFGHTTAIRQERTTSEMSQSRELEADEFAGYVAAKMGATPEDMEDLPRAIFSMGSPTHPDSFKRLKAMVRGWVAGGGEAENLEERLKAIFDGIIEDVQKW